MYEEQEMELQALEAIFMSDFTIQSNIVPFQFTIVINPAEEDESNVGVVLSISLPENYPEDSPAIEYQTVKGLKGSALVELDSIIEEEIESNRGTAMIFSIVQRVKDWLIERNNVKPVSMHDAIGRKDLQLGPSIGVQVLIDNTPKKDSTPFSMDLFLIWNERFKEQLLESEAKEQHEAIDTGKSGRITGKQFFEMRSAINFEEKDEDEENVYFIDESVYDEDIED